MGEPSFGPGPGSASLAASSAVGAGSTRAASSSEPSPSSSDAKPQLPEQLRAWEAILAAIRDDKPALASVYEHAAPLEVSAQRVHLAYRDGTFLAEQAAANEAQAILAGAASKHFGSEVAIEIDLGSRHDEVQSVAAKNAAALAARVQAARERVKQHPLVAAAVEHLGAELREVRLPNDFS
jgi:DNA polymerase-3 subunit gamma/tau